METREMNGQVSPSKVDVGIKFVVRYMGSIAVNASMKSLDFNVRSNLAKECILRVCEAANMLTVNKKRKVDKQLLKYLPGEPNRYRSGEDVTLTISTRNIVVGSMEKLEYIFDHPVPNISFASGGDLETLNFVGYVAKDEKHGRCCYVFECSAGDAFEVLKTIKEAFDLRFQQVTSTPVTTVNTAGPTASNAAAAAALPPLPVPATAAGPTATTVRPVPRPVAPPRHNLANARKATTQNDSPPTEPAPRVTVASSPRSPCLIDLNSPTLANSQHQYVNNSVTTPTNGVFFAEAVPPYVQNILGEEWFHGSINRLESETLIQNDGEFLVRVTRKCDQEQVVLTGMQNGVHKHLLLIDDQGKVRTKDREFESVRHLIEYHRNNRLPITSAESSILLRKPVCAKV